VPWDFIPRLSCIHQAAGSHFHKVGITLWRAADPDGFELLVRRSFIDHFWQLVVAGSQEFGLTAAVAA
jgi:heterotetrameric sarcosine oxidase gamma subunit